MNIDLLVTWIDVGEIVFFGLLVFWVYKRGVKAGIKQEQDRILMDWVKRTMKETGHDE